MRSLDVSAETANADASSSAFEKNVHERERERVVSFLNLDAISRF